MLNVALTGNVAAGKSTVVDELERLGATVIDADELVREAQAPGSSILATIVRRFGREMLAADGTLDRAALRTRVLADEAALTALNAIVHPEVRRRRAAIIAAAAAQGDLVVVSDIPLLFEAADPKEFDVIVLVDANSELRRDRLVALRGLSEDDATRLIATQLPTARKREVSDYVIDNDGSIDALQQATRAVWLALRREAARRAVDGRAEALLFVAHRPADLARGPAGTAARYADAGLRVHLLTTAPARAASVVRLAETLGLRAVEHTSALDGPSAVKARARVHPDAVVVCTAKAPRWALDAWRFARRSRQPTARLDVRPWRDIVARVRDEAPLDRETFTRTGERPDEPRSDLFTSA
jgi:dephospho-CoA kinase